MDKQIELAKELPAIGTGLYDIDKADPNAKETWPPRKTEYDMKDQMIRSSLQRALQDIEDLKEEIKRLRERD